MFKNYEHNGCFDEMLDEQGVARAHYRSFHRLFEQLPAEEFEHRRHSVDLAFLRQGITFNVYGDSQGAEKIFPFDLIPRIIAASEWDYLQRGLIQRITALSLFLHDIYPGQKIIKDGGIPPHYVLSEKQFHPEIVNCKGTRDVSIP